MVTKHKLANMKISFKNNSVQKYGYIGQFDPCAGRESVIQQILKFFISARKYFKTLDIF